MLKHTKILTGAVLSLILTFPAIAQDTTADTVVATVNGTDITVGHLIIARRGLPEQYQSLPDEVLFEGLTQQMIQEVALSQSLNGQETDALRLSIENETRSIRANEAVAQVVAKAITDDAVQAVYDERYGSGPTPEYNASHILVETEEEAIALIEALEGGADFAELAQEKSTGPSGPNGGALGWFGQGAMVPAFEAAVIALEVGAVSAPVETQFGWHVVTLNDTRETPPPALEDVRAELEAAVEQAAVEDLITSSMEGAEIFQTDAGTIDPAVLSNPDLLVN